MTRDLINLDLAEDATGRDVGRERRAVWLGKVTREWNIHGRSVFGDSCPQAGRDPA